MPPSFYFRTRANRSRTRARCLQSLSLSILMTRLPPMRPVLITTPMPDLRSEPPRDLVGDVVIVVTIDSQGNVVETKVVQTVGHGIDEKIEATVRRWHFQPATLDGAPVASHVDVHFHFPS